MSELLAVVSVFLVAVGFRLAALTLPTAQRRRVNRIAIQITLAAAALGILVAVITPLPPLATVIGAVTCGAVAATAMILAQGSSARASRPPRTSIARRSGRLAGAHADRATALGGTLRQLLEQFEADFGPWGEGRLDAGPRSGADRSASQPRPIPATADAPYRVLGVTRDDDRNAVRARYLELVKRDHPDNFPISKHHTPGEVERRAQAEANLKIVTEAYRLVRVERGWS